MRWGGSVGFLDGDLKDEKGRLIVHATSTVKIVRPKARLRSAPASARRSGRRVANQAPPFVFMCATMRSRAAMRPGRPIMRRCRPIDIIFGWPLAFGPQRVEGVGRVVGEVARRHEAMEALVIVHVVGVEAVGQHQVPLAQNLDEERQVVGIVVAVVEKAAFLDQQAARVGRGRRARVCQPTGRVPAISVSTFTVRAIAWRSAASSMWACFSQRQPWQEISWPRFTASSISQGESSAALPQALTVAGTPSRSSVSAIRHHAGLGAVLEVRFHAAVGQRLRPRR